MPSKRELENRIEKIGPNPEGPEEVVVRIHQSVVEENEDGELVTVDEWFDEFGPFSSE